MLFVNLKHVFANLKHVQVGIDQLYCPFGGECAVNELGMKRQPEHAAAVSDAIST
jgi:hypothetical protein